MKRRSFVLIGMLFVFAVTSSCKKENPEPTGLENQSASESMTDFALEAIDSVTENLSRGDLPIVIRFKQAPLKEAQNGDIDFISIEPAQPGTLKWLDQWTVHFTPKRGFKAGEKYLVEVDLNKLYSTEKQAGTFRFALSIAPHEVVSFKASFESKTPTSSKIVLLGTIELNQELELDDVKNSMQLKQAEGGSIPIKKWEQRGQVYSFKIGGFKRGDKTKRYILTFAGQDLGIEKTEEREVDLHKLEEFSVLQAGYEGSGKDAVFRFEMNSDLASQIKISDFIKISPTISTKASYIGRRISVSADYTLGKVYRITLKKGVRSKWNNSLAEDYSKKFTSEDLVPQVEFSQKGVYLSTLANEKIAFQSTNVRNVRVQLKEVFSHNVGQFLQDTSLNAAYKNYNNGFDINRVGKTRFSEEKKIDLKRNIGSQSVIDLSKAIKNKKGLYILELSFKKEDMAFKCKKNQAGAGAEAADPEEEIWYYNGKDDYYGPCRHRFWYSKNRVSKPIIISDIGLSYKKTHDGAWIFATDIRTGTPMPGVKLQAHSYQQSMMGSGTTDGQGLAKLVFDEGEDRVHYIVGHKGQQQTAFRPQDSYLNLSTFDIGGASSNNGLQIFTYTERGVYRPGDPLHLSVVMRDRSQTFPDNHPLELRLLNPKGKEITRQTLKKSQDGFYVFPLQTNTSARTGIWTAQVYLAGKPVASHRLKIETVVAPRLKVKLKVDKEELGPEDKVTKLNIESQYLFGAPAAELRAEVKGSLSHTNRYFKDYKDFLFSASSMRLQTRHKDLFEGNLSAEGKTQVSWKLPSHKNIPSDLVLSYAVKVYEKGGRFVSDTKRVIIKPWTHYVGIKAPHGKARVGSETELEVILLDRKGKAAADRELKVRIYSNRHRWWWRSHSGSYHDRYKSDKETRLFVDKIVRSKDSVIKVPFTPKEHGELLFEITDKEGGHMASALMWTNGYRRPDDSNKSVTLLNVAADKERYLDGETATLSFKAPGKSHALVTVERGGFVLDTFWHELSSSNAQVKLPIKREYGPNVYAFVHIYQALVSVENDIPLRSYGIVNINVDDPERKLKLELQAPKEIKPRSEFSITVKNNDQRDAQYTIAIVDEGLLSLTRFKTPDAENFFYAKQAIGVRTSDMYEQVIGLIWGDIAQRFSIGGDAPEERKQVNKVKAKRFEPVSLFKGPLQIEAGAERQMTFKMPNYNGSVRIMLIAAKNEAYASLDKSVPVRAPLVLLPTLPRVAGPGDIFDMPVSVFALKEKMGTTKLDLTVEGPISIIGKKSRSIDFSAIGEKEVLFRLKGDEAMGVAKIRLAAKAAKHQASYQTELAVRPASAVTSGHKDKSLKAKETIEFEIPQKGLKAGQTAELIVSTLPDLGFQNRAAYLIRYPYGCAEQTTSAAFPQLYLREIFPNLFRADEIDRNINAALNRLAGFQGHAGGFYTWRYWNYHNKKYADWTTSWIGHFMVEAERKGYYVSPRVLKKWKRYQKREASVSDDIPNLYRLYTLALAGEAQIGLMNRIREEYKNTLAASQLSLLAGAYAAAGLNDIASQLMSKYGTVDAKFKPHGREYYNYYWRYSYGSSLRDTAIELQQYTTLGQEQRAFLKYKIIAQKLSSNRWYNTQTQAWSLIAIGQFVQKFRLGNAPIEVKVEFADGSSKEIESNANSVSLPLTEYIGQKVKISSNAETTLFTSIAFDYLPLRPENKAINDNMDLKVRFFGENGQSINEADMLQGKSMWAVYQIVSSSEHSIENVALTQILPAGWEIENTRLTGEVTPRWLHKKFYLGGEDYVDIRDDRIMWFFDLREHGYRYHSWNAMAFAVKLNTVASGEFDMAAPFAEAMYDANYRSRVPGKRVMVTRPRLQ